MLPHGLFCYAVLRRSAVCDGAFRFLHMRHLDPLTRCCTSHITSKRSYYICPRSMALNIVLVAFSLLRFLLSSAA